MGKKETRIRKYIKGLIRNRKYLTVEDICLYLERYYGVPISVPSVFYKYKKIINECRREVYNERRREKRRKKSSRPKGGRS
ncbi:MAG: hypothetical protein GXO08_03290 [Aquificae bacterium]|nr:hypothetical protein [Aquificota bacterium]